MSMQICVVLTSGTTVSQSSSTSAKLMPCGSWDSERAACSTLAGLAASRVASVLRRAMEGASKVANRYVVWGGGGPEWHIRLDSQFLTFLL